MRDDIVLLAVTKMLSGFCIGGISLATGKWVRPVKEHGTILLGDIRYADGTFMRPFDVVRMELSTHRPKPPHIEDWVADFIRPRPEVVGRLEGSERVEFMEKFAVPGGMNDLLAAKLSLVLCTPVPTAASFSLDEYSGKYDARVFVPLLSGESFPGQVGGRIPPTANMERGIPVTDLKWRALGRKLITNGENPLKLSAAKLKSLIGVEKIHLALGLSRLHEGRHWPLVVGVHTIPDYDAEVDHSEP